MPAGAWITCFAEAVHATSVVMAAAHLKPSQPLAPCLQGHAVHGHAASHCSGSAAARGGPHPCRRRVCTWHLPVGGGCGLGHSGCAAGGPRPCPALRARPASGPVLLPAVSRRTHHRLGASACPPPAAPADVQWQAGMRHGAPCCPPALPPRKAPPAPPAGRLPRPLPGGSCALGRGWARGPGSLQAALSRPAATTCLASSWPAGLQLLVRGHHTARQLRPTSCRPAVPRVCLHGGRPGRPPHLL